MVNKILKCTLVWSLFQVPIIAQSYDVLRSAGRDELFHDYLLEELEVVINKRKADVAIAQSSPEQMEKRQSTLRQNYLNLLGTLPEKTPLSAVVTDTKTTSDGYKIEKLHYQSAPNHHVTANFYIPTTGSAPYPTVLILSGHYPIAKSYVDYQDLCILFAKNGIAAMIVDPICQSERYQVTGNNGQLSMVGQSGTGAHSRLDVGAVLTGTSIVAYELWDNHRAVDYLYSRTNVVDTSRVGCTGHSGGGAQATYLLAYDQRLKVGTVANFITNETSMFTESGPQTGSQNLSFEGEFGIDQPDYVALFAPKPLLMIGTTTDAIFKINAARQTLAESKSTYGLWDAEGNVDLFITNDSHDYTQPKREATVEWYKKWFLNDENPVQEGNQNTLSQSDLTVTNTGQVYTEFPNEKNIADLNIEKANQLKNSRLNFWTNQPLHQCLDSIKRLVRYEPLNDTPENSVTGEIDRENYTIQKSQITYKNHVPVTALTFVPVQVSGKLPAVLYVDGRGKKTDAGSRGVIENVYMKGNKHVVMSVDVRGFGETADNAAKNESKHNNQEHRNGVISLYVGKTLVGQRVEDIEKAMKILSNHPNVDTTSITLVGVDRASVAVLHAAAFNTGFRNVIIRMSSKTSWLDAVSDPNIKDQMTHEVPNALKYYTLSDLVKYGFETRNVIFAEEPFKGNPVGVNEVSAFQNSNPVIFPNPIKDVSTIRYISKENNQLQLTIFDCLGRKVKSMHQVGIMGQPSDFLVNGNDFVPGTYVYQLSINKIPTTAQQIQIMRK